MLRLVSSCRAFEPRAESAGQRKPAIADQNGPVHIGAASLSTNKARLTMSSIEPSSAGWDDGPQLFGGLARQEPADAFGISDRARGDRVDANLLRPPLDGELRVSASTAAFAAATCA